MSSSLDLEPIIVRPTRPPAEGGGKPRAARPGAARGRSSRPAVRRRHGSDVPLDPVLVSPLRRPEPKPELQRTPARTVRSYPRLLRIAVAVVAGTVVLALAGRVARVAVEPVVATYRTGLQIRQLQNELKQEAARNDRLQQDIAYLQTPAGVEQEARRRGWVKEGEIALTLLPADGAATETTALDEGRPASSKQVVVSDRIRAAVDTCLAVLGGHPRAN